MQSSGYHSALLCSVRSGGFPRPGGSGEAEKRGHGHDKEGNQSIQSFQGIYLSWINLGMMHTWIYPRHHILMYTEMMSP